MQEDGGGTAKDGSVKIEGEGVAESEETDSKEHAYLIMCMSR